MPRLPYLEPETASAGAHAVLDAMPPFNFVRMLAHAETAAVPFFQLAGELQQKCALPADLREMAILRTSHRAGCAYEVHYHERRGRDEGLDDARLAALADLHNVPAADVFGDDVAALLRLVDDVCDHIEASEKSLADAVARFSPRQIVETVLLVGLYHMVARLIRTTGIELETIDPLA